MNRDTVLAASPWVEVFVKTLYWRSSLIYSLLTPHARKRPIPIQKSTNAAEKLPFGQITSELAKLGVIPGGIMIVHSSVAALKSTGLSPTQICEQLIGFLGPEGTLAMPAIPLYRDEPTGPERLTDAICSRRLTYDVRSTPPWTGALPKALMGMTGAVRSRHPLNSMVAIGRHAASMMQGNIDGDLPTACGPNSSWKFCSDHKATIVCLGVDTAHSLTMIHVAEDSWAGQWPISNWYRERLFHVKDGEFEADLTVLERRPKWSINYGERTLQKDLINQGILEVSNVGGVRIEVCESGKLISYLNSRKSSGYPYWVPFWTRQKP